MLVVCETCGVNMERSDKEMSRAKHHYCSLRCLHQGQRGDRVGAWRGGRTSNGSYIRVYHPDHPRQYQGYVLEHILVAEEMLGRPILRGERVHHMNHIKTDNRPENLLVLANQEKHSQYHPKPIASPRFCWCGAPHVAKGLCNKHYKQAWREKQPKEESPVLACLICGDEYYGKGYCRKHYMHEYFQARAQKREPVWPLHIKLRKPERLARDPLMGG